MRPYATSIPAHIRPAFRKTLRTWGRELLWEEEEEEEVLSLRGPLVMLPPCWNFKFPAKNQTRVCKFSRARRNREEREREREREREKETKRKRRRETERERRRERGGVGEVERKGWMERETATS